MGGAGCDGVIVAHRGGFDRGHEIWEYDFTQFVEGKNISVFDANTFPGNFRAFANNWLEATDAEWDAYQAFVEAAREEFFSREGIEEEVAAIEDINPDLKSLWGMIYWAQENRDRVIEGQIMPVVTPKEIRIIMEEFPSLSAPYGRPRYDELIVLPDGTTSYAGWGFQHFYTRPNGSWYQSSEVGEIIGRNDIMINHEPVNTVFGDLALLARFFPDKADPVLVLTHLKLSPENQQPFRHVLFAQMAAFDETYTLPKGTICRAWDTNIIPSDCQGCQGTMRKFELPVDYFILPLEIATSRKLVTLGDLFSKLGDGISFEPPLMRYGGPRVINGVQPFECLDPNLGMEIAGRTGRTDQPINLYPYAWPWQGQPPVHAWEFEDFADRGKTEGWSIEAASFELDEGDIIIKSNGDHTRVTSPEFQIDSSVYKKAQIRMRVSAGDIGRVIFETENGANASQEGTFELKADGLFHTYTISFVDNPNWDGVITGLQLIPTNVAGSVEIEYIHLTGLHDFEFEEEGDAEGWEPFSNYADFRVALLKNNPWGTPINPTVYGPWGSLMFQTTGTDPAILSPVMSINAEDITTVQLGMRVSCGTKGELFFTTDEDAAFSEAKSITFEVGKWNVYQTYLLDMTSNPFWSGNITQIRIDPVQCRGTVEIDFVRFLASTE